MLDCIFATIKRNFIVKLRAYPLDWFISRILSGFYLVLSTYFIYKIMFNKTVSSEFISITKTQDYMSYVILGGIIYLFVLGNIFGVSRSLIIEMGEGTIPNILIAPVSYFSYLIGCMIEQALITVFETAVILLMGIPFGLKLSSINICSAALCLVISLISIFGMSLILGSIMIFLRNTYITQNTFFIAINFFCGVLFPIEYLPKFVQVISYCIPITYSIKIFRNSILLGQDIMSQMLEFCLLALTTILYVCIGLAAIKKTMKIIPTEEII